MAKQTVNQAVDTIERDSDPQDHSKVVDPAKAFVDAQSIAARGKDFAKKVAKKLTADGYPEAGNAILSYAGVALAGAALAAGSLPASDDLTDDMTDDDASEIDPEFAAFLASILGSDQDDDDGFDGNDQGVEDDGI